MDALAQWLRLVGVVLKVVEGVEAKGMSINAAMPDEIIHDSRTGCCKGD